MANKQRQIRERFTFYLSRDPEIIDAHKQIRLTCEALALLIDAYVPDGREKEISLIKIEEASFWANAAISRKHGEAQEG